MTKNYFKSVFALILASMLMIPSVAQNIRKANESGSTLYGFKYSDKSLNEINFTGIVTKLWSTDFSETNGFIEGDQFVAFNQRAVATTAMSYYEIYDVKTGQLLTGQTTLKCSDHQQRIIKLAYNPESKQAYAFTYGKTKTANRMFKVIDCSDLSVNLKNKFTTMNSSVAEADVPAAMAFNPSDGEIYAIMQNGDLATINIADGSAKVIGATGFTPNDQKEQALGYSPFDKTLFWIGILSGETTCKLYSIDTTSGAATEVCTLGDGDQYSILVTPDKAVDASAPAAAIPTPNFIGGALTGSIDIVLPSKDANDNPLTGTVYVALVIDGGEEITLSGEAGSTVSHTVTFKEGTHTIQSTSYLLKGEERLDGMVISVDFYAGNDTPAAPANVVLTKNSITWEAISDKGINNGWVDAQAATYNVYLNDSLLTPTPISATSLEIQQPQSVLKKYKAKVEAIVNGKKSARGISNEEELGQPLAVPFTLTPTEDEFALFTIIDANKDANSWEYTDTTTIGPSVFYKATLDMTGTGDIAADDWLILPAAQFNSIKKTFIFSLDVKNNGNFYYPETFEVKIGKSANPEEMTSLMDTITITSKEWTTYSKEFSVAEEGEWYIGVHCISAADMWCLFARNFKVVQSENSAYAPSEVENLTVTAFEKGELKAKVSFNLPSVDRNGAKLEADKKVKATVTSSSAEASVEGLPGEAVSVDIATCQGTDTLTVSVSNEYGNGISTTTTVYCGYDKPKAMPLITSISEDNMSVTISWDAPTEGVDGHYVDPAKVYYIVQLSIGNAAYERIDTIEPNAELKYSYTYTSPATAKEQNKYSLAVVPGIWESGRAEIAYSDVMLGKPYEMPIVDKFATWKFMYNPIVIMSREPGYDATWTYAETSGAEGLPDAGINGQYALFCYYPTATAGLGKVMLPKFSTKDVKNARIGFTAYTYKDMPHVEILLEANDMETKTVYAIDSTSGKGWTQYYFPMPEEYLDKPWVDIQVKTIFEPTDGYFLLGGYSVETAYANDLEIASVEGNNFGRVGETNTFKASVINGGSTPLAAGSVTMTVNKGSKVIATETVAANKILQVGESVPVEFSFTPTADQSGNFLVYFRIDTEDENMENNEFESYLNVVLGSQPIVNDLAAEQTEGNVKLTWTAPEMPKKGIEDFEIYSPFTYGDSFGDWMNVDKDKYNTCFSENLNIPGAGAKKAFQVLNYNLLESRVDLRPYDGTQCLMAFCPSNGYRANDWLISPEVVPGSTVTFQTRSVSSYYSEELQVLASSTDRNPDSFSVLEEIVDSLTSWSEHKIQLPEDAKYFAIRYRSPDQFGILIDAIEYSPVAEVAEITGYNIYRNGDKVAENLKDCEYTDSALEAGNYKYNVTTITSRNGEHTENIKSNTATVELSTGISNITAEGNDEPMYNLAGQRITNGFKGIAVSKNYKSILK